MKYKQYFYLFQAEPWRVHFFSPAFSSRSGKKQADELGYLQYGWWQQAHPHLDGNFFQRCLKRFDDTIRLNSLKLKKHANSFIMIWVCAVLVFHSSTFSNSSDKQQYITQVISQRVVKIENLTRISWISEFLFVTPKMSKNGIH